MSDITTDILTTDTAVEAVADLAQRAAETQVVPLADTQVLVVTQLGQDVRTSSIVAVLDGHEQHGIAGETHTDAGWGTHRATLKLRHTPAWEHWTKRAAEMLSQEVFAEHVEDGLEQIQDPPAGVMLELAQSFYAHTSATFRRAQRLDSGETQLVYSEEVTARAGRSDDITIPREFELGLTPYEGGPSFKVKARLRYRAREGVLTLGYHLVRVDDILRQAFDEILEGVEGTTGLTAYRALAPAPLR